jgi:hypothetical protein
MPIGPGRPGEIEPPGHPFFGSAKENENAFRAAETGFWDPVEQAGSIPESPVTQLDSPHMKQINKALPTLHVPPASSQVSAESPTGNVNPEVS